MRIDLPCIAAALVFVSIGSALAQFKDQANGRGVSLGEAHTVVYRAGMIVQAEGGSCRSLVGSVAVPFDWPEQETRIVEEDISQHVKAVRYRTTDGAVKEMVVEIPFLQAGEEARALVTFEVTTHTIQPPPDTSIFKVPSRASRDVLKYLGPSPYIESRHPKIRALAKEVGAGEDRAWQQVEAIYDYVRSSVQYQEGPLKGALEALRDGTGDCEELSSLFIALCRASKIPARTVWVHGHCYPEFYLVDDEGEGYWFPCQAAGSRAFGEMPDSRPILQKGDNFVVQGKSKERERYVGEFLRGLPVPGGGRPKVHFVREIVQQ